MTDGVIIVNDRAQALAAYPHARKVGDFIFVSGISSRTVDNNYEGVEVKPDGSLHLDIRKQTRAVIENIKAILEHAGSSLADLVDLTVFLVDMTDYAGMNEVYDEYFTREAGPSRTTVAVKQLPSPKLLIEIKSVAYCKPQ